MKKYAVTGCLFAAYMVFMVITLKGATPVAIDIALIVGLVLLLFVGWTLTLIRAKERYSNNRRTFVLEFLLAMGTTALIVTLSLMNLLT